MKLAKDNLGKVAVTVSDSYWDINKDYPKLLIIEVKDQYQTYISRRPVPAGTQITNRKYWIPFSSLKEQIKLNYSKWFKEYGSLISSNAATLNKLQLELNNLTRHLPGIYFSGSIDSFERFTTSEVELTFGTNDGQPAEFKLYANNELIFSVNDSSYSYTVQVDDSVEFRVECLQNNILYESSWNVASVAPYYIGAGDSYTDVLDKEEFKIGAKLDVSGVYTIEVTEENPFFICVPDNLVIDAIKMNGWDIPEKAPYDVESSTGVNYRIYESRNEYIVGNHIIQINNYAGEESDLLYRLIDDVTTYDDSIENAVKVANEAFKHAAITNDEDITKNAEKELIFADKSYLPSAFSGLGRKYLRKNLINSSFEELLPFNGFVENVTIEQISPIMVPDVIYYDTENKLFVAAKLSLDEQKYYNSWNDSSAIEPKASKYMYPSANTGFVYNSKTYRATSDGLVESIDTLTNVLTQHMISTSNTIYKIQYDYDLQGNEIVIPENCVLVFEGGSFKNGTVVGNSTRVYSLAIGSPFSDISLSGVTMLSDAAFTGSYNDLTDKPDIYIKHEIDNAFAGKVDIGSVYDIEQMNLMLGEKASVSSLEELASTIPHNTSDLNNDNNFVNDSQVDEKLVNCLATKADVSMVENLAQAVGHKADANDVYNKDAVDGMFSDVNTQLGGKASTTALESLGTSVQDLSENTYSKHESDIKFATNEELSKATTLNKTFDISNVDYARIATGWKIAVSADDNNLIWENTNSENPADVDCYILVPKNLFGDLGIQLNPFINGAKLEEGAPLAITFYPFKDGELIGSTGSDIVGFSIFYKDIATQVSTFFTNNVQPWLRRTDFNQIGILITNTNSSNLVFTAGDSVSLVIKTKGQAAAKGYGYEITYDDLLKYNKEGNFTMVTSDNRNYVVGVRDNTTGVMSYPIGNSQKPSGTSLTQSEFEALNTAMATGMKTLVIIPITGDTMLDTSAKLNIYNTANN